MGYHWESPTIDCDDFPSVRYWTSTIAIGARIYVFGGYGGCRRHNDLYIFDTLRMTWTPPPLIQGLAPAMRSSHSACPYFPESGDPVCKNGMMVIFGGYQGRFKVNDLHLLKIYSDRLEEKTNLLRPVVEWIQPKTVGKPPTVRHSHSADIVDGNKMFVIGGQSVRLSRDVHMLVLPRHFDEKSDDAVFRWIQVPIDTGKKKRGQSASNVDRKWINPRSCHTCNVVQGHKVMLFGGITGHQSENSLYSIDVSDYIDT